MDMDLIEVLWKQDVDLGFSLDMPGGKSVKQSDALEVKSVSAGPATSVTLPDDDIEKLKTLEALNNDALKTEDLSDADDSWAGLSYDIDTETGEYILKGTLEEELPTSECDSPLPLGDLPLPEFLLEEALQLVGLDDHSTQESVNQKEVDCLSLGPNVGEPIASISESSPRSISASSDGVAASSSAASSCTSTSSSNRGFPSKELDSDEELDLLTDMIQTAQFHHPHPRAFQSRMPFVRTMSMEQRWQDLANLLSLPSPGDTGGMPPHPFAHHHHHHPALHNYSHPHGHGMTYGPDATRGVLLHNATLNPPMGDINGTGPYTNIGGTNLGSAVATSMNLTNSSEPMGEHNVGPHYKIETPHDMLYYPNPSSEMNQTTEGFLSSILNDEDLQLMDMAMNEGMYTMRMLENNNAISNLSISNTSSATMGRSDAERIDASSDSAVSSMGSERVPSLSDGEWCDAGSDSGHTPGDHYVVDYHGSKYRPYDYSYNSRQHSTSIGSSDTSRIPPVAQKKHHMFGKRYFQEQGTSAVTQQPPNPVKYEYGDSTTPAFTGSLGQTERAVGHKPPEIKYSCTMEFARHHQPTRPSIEPVQHNHTYHLPAESTGAMQRPISRDKSKGRKSEEEHLTRDEKRARALNVPMSVDDIINLPMDEFNERLSKYDLSEPQLSLIRDIRRRGKNKVAAQNCRKRKLDQILSLADEVKEMRDRKHRLITERDFMVSERQRIKEKFAKLYRHVFQNLRDPDGNHYSPYQYSLQQSADGSVLLVPRANTTMTDQEHKEPHHNCKE